MIALTSSQLSSFAQSIHAWIADGDDQQRVVARDAEQARARHGEHGQEEERDEQAGARFLGDEVAELESAAPQPGQLGTGLDLEEVCVEGAKHSGPTGASPDWCPARAVGRRVPGCPALPPGARG